MKHGSEWVAPALPLRQFPRFTYTVGVRTHSNHTDNRSTGDMMRKIGLPGIALVSCISLSPLALTACGGTEAADTVTGNSSLNVSVASALGAFDNVSAIRLTITETNADGSPKAGPWTYTRDLQRNGNVWTTNVGGVPLGHYHVVAEARNAGGTVLFAGEDRVHVSTDDTFMMTIIMQEDFDPTLTNQSPLFRSVTGNKANVNHGETLSLRIGATDPDGNTGLQLVGAPTPARAAASPTSPGPGPPVPRTPVRPRSCSS